MPEADAVRRCANALDRAFRGKVISDWELRWPQWVHTDHRGAATLEVTSIGKHILHRLDDGYTLHSHLRMDGSWKIYTPLDITRKHLAATTLRAILGAGDVIALGWELGMLDVVRTEQEAGLIGHLGPAILCPDFDVDLAVSNLERQPHREIGAALLDQTNLAGIGTIWNAETLFLERIWPWSAIGALSPEQLVGVVIRARDLIEAAMAYPHSCSTGDIRNPTYAHERKNRPCHVCGTPIRLEMIGEPPQHRVMYFCPNCQAPKS